MKIYTLSVFLFYFVFNSYFELAYGQTLADTIKCKTDEDCLSYGLNYCCAVLRLEGGGQGAY